MKIAVFLLLPLLVATAPSTEIHVPVTGSDRSSAGIIVDGIYVIRDQMPCGFPNANIPPMAPLVVAHKLLKIDAGSFQVELEFKNFVLSGLNDFEVIDYIMQPLLRGNMVFHMLWHKLHLKTWYRLKVVSTGGFKLNFERSGEAEISMKDIAIAGKAKYDLGLKDGDAVVLHEFYIYPNIGEVVSKIENLSSKNIVNNVLNSIVAEWISIAINDYSEDIGQVVNDNLVPTINSLLGGRSFEQIINDLLGSQKSLLDMEACTVVAPPVPQIAVEEIVMDV